jgi:WD40 repeat protein
MTTDYNYLAVGGQRSQLVVRRLDTGWFGQISVGGSINNALCISKQQEGLRLLICNNDETIKVYSLPELNRVCSISVPTAVNYCAVSPDGRKMAAVGDSNQVYLYDIRSNSYEKVATYTASNDAGFSCSWNQSSDKLAVASQDGYVSVWDLRSSEKLAKLETRQVLNP